MHDHPGPGLTVCHGTTTASSASGRRTRTRIIQGGFDREGKQRFPNTPTTWIAPGSRSVRFPGRSLVAVGLVCSEYEHETYDETPASSVSGIYFNNHIGCDKFWRTDRISYSCTVNTSRKKYGLLNRNPHCPDCWSDDTTFVARRASVA